MEKYFLQVLKFVIFWLGSLSASAGKTKNSCHSALILPNQGSWAMNKPGGVQISFLSGVGNAVILYFSWIFG